MASILLDTSFVVALNNPKDKYHSRATGFIVGMGRNAHFVLPEVVLPEATFLLGRAGGIPAVIAFMQRLVATQAVLQSLTLQDIQRA